MKRCLRAICQALLVFVGAVASFELAVLVMWATEPPKAERGIFELDFSPSTGEMAVAAVYMGLILAAPVMIAVAVSFWRAETARKHDMLKAFLIGLAYGGLILAGSAGMAYGGPAIGTCVIAVLVIAAAVYRDRQRRARPSGG